MNALAENKIKKVLDELHGKAAADSVLRRQQKEAGTLDKDRQWATAYMAVSKEEGEFLYFMADTVKAKQIVEFGCSFGISTIYLAAAARNNGGRVVSTDIEHSKIAGAGENLAEAGLAEHVEMLEGDAMQTLSTIEGSVDLLFLDGAKEIYLPVFELLRDRLSAGAIIVADNVDKPETHPLTDHILSRAEEFTAIYMFDGRVLLARVN